MWILITFLQHLSLLSEQQLHQCHYSITDLTSKKKMVKAVRLVFRL